MFENYKLNKYVDFMDGFGYEITDGFNGKYSLQIYIVLKDNDNYKFIKYRKFKHVSVNVLYAWIDEYQARHISEFVKKDLGKQLKKVSK